MRQAHLPARLARARSDPPGTTRHGPGHGHSRYQTRDDQPDAG